MKQVASIDTRQLDLIDHSYLPSGFLKAHYAQIQEQIKALGADIYDLALPETHVLPLIIHLNEKIEGLVYGKYTQNSADGSAQGRGVLVATDRRILLIDHKPLFIKCNEISYHVINAINYSKAGIAGTVTLHTRLGNISVRTFNQKCANGFVEAIEASVFASKDPAFA